MGRIINYNKYAHFLYLVYFLYHKTENTMAQSGLIDQTKYNCPVELTLDIIGGKWKCLIIHHLMDGTKRFNEIRRLIPKVTQRMLTLQLRELERDNIVHRKVYAVVPPKTEYSLSKLGKTLEPLLWAMHDWGNSVMHHDDRK